MLGESHNSRTPLCIGLVDISRTARASAMVLGWCSLTVAGCHVEGEKVQC